MEMNNAIEHIMPNFTDGFDFIVQSQPLESNCQSDQLAPKQHLINQ